MTEPGFAPLPGNAPDAIPPYKPMRRGLGALLAHAYVRRIKVMGSLLVVLGIAAVPLYASHLTDLVFASSPVAEDAAPTLTPEEVSDDDARKAAELKIAKEIAILDKAQKTARKAQGLAKQDTGNEAILIAKRLAAIEKLVSEGNLGEAENVIASIEGIITTLEASVVNASPVITTPSAPAPAAEAANAKADKTMSTVEAKLVAVANDMSSDLEIRIADGDGVESGFWRSSGGLDQHFVIVEAADRDGKPYEWKVRDMDTNEVSRTNRWAVPVSAEEFSRLSAEKAISGKLPDTLAGVKKPGSIQIEWKIETDGKSLSDWKENTQ